ncbi:hypothetical protein DASC09_063150 [Saccharomycopsis crataegensis]|uniref:Zn(2)-C6 fungal-type domain-containing protein n=1 Tax=Saccharomycopsis crataegensis TaxID=43959 RepID=A0AAV5QWW6_9ASCO|nr:hypothetical protein DASC09_063150 [Saccharomycopsis crataegensis]
MADLSDENKKKRRRVPLSCTSCRKKKIRCDRDRPICGACAKSGQGAAICEYDEPFYNGNGGEYSHIKAATQPIGLIQVQKFSINKNPKDYKPPKKPSNPGIGGVTNVFEGSGAYHESFINYKNIKHADTTLPPSSHFSRFRLSSNDLSLNKTPADFIKNPTATSVTTVSTPEISSQYLPNSNERANNDEYMLKPIEFKSSINHQPPAISSQQGGILPTTILTNPEQGNFSSVPVNFYDGVASIKYRKPKFKVSNCGPLSGINLLQRDFYGRVLFRNMVKFRKSIPHTLKRLSKQPRKEFIPKSLANDDQRTPLPPADRGKHKHIELGLKNGSFKDYDDETKLCEEISRVLPPKDVIYIYVDRFFKYVYPFFPLLDEQAFRDDLLNLIGPKSPGSVSSGTSSLDKVEIVFDSKNKILDTATLLIVLKLAFLSVYSYKYDGCAPKEFGQQDSPSPINNCNEQNSEIKLLMNYPITSPIFKLAKGCLNNFNFLRKTGLGLVQTLYYCRIYNCLGFEEGDGPGGSESNIFAGVIFSSAISIGLHRDPVKNMLNFWDCDGESVKFLQLWRKLWFSLIDLDIEQSMNCSSIPSLNQDFSDTKYPSYENLVSGSNCSDLNIEKIVLDHILSKNEINAVIKKLLEKICTMKKVATIGELEEDLSELERYMKVTFRGYKDLVNDFCTRKTAKLPKYDYISAVSMVKKMRSYFSMVEFVFTIKYHILLAIENNHKENIYSQQFSKYLTELFELSCEALLITKFWSFYGDSYIDNFHSFQYLLSSNVMMSLMKYSSFFCSFLMRLISLKYGMLLHQNEPGSQYDRSSIIFHLILLEWLFEKGVEYLTYICLINDNYSDSFHCSSKGRIVSRYCLKCVTDEKSDIDYSAHNLFRNGILEGDRSTDGKLFPDTIKHYDFSQLKPLFTLFEKFEQTNAHLDNISSRVIPPTLKSISTNSDSSRIICIEDIVAQLSKEDLVSSYLKGSGPLAVDDVHRLWKFFSNKYGADNSERKLKVRAYIEKNNSSNTLAFKFHENKNKDTKNNSADVVPAMNIPVSTHSESEFEYKGQNLVNDSGKNVDQPYFSNGSVDMDSLMTQEQFNWDDNILLDDLLRIDDDALDIFGIEGMNFENFH